MIEQERIDYLAERVSNNENRSQYICLHVEASKKTGDAVGLYYEVASKRYSVIPTHASHQQDLFFPSLEEAAKYFNWLITS